MKEMKKFIPSIDNLSSVQKVKSIMVVPLYGTADLVTGEKPVTGILQLINKIDKVIDEHDVKQVGFISGLLGRGI